MFLVKLAHLQIYTYMCVLMWKPPLSDESPASNVDDSEVISLSFLRPISHLVVQLHPCPHSSKISPFCNCLPRFTVSSLHRYVFTTVISLAALTSPTFLGEEDCDTPPLSFAAETSSCWAKLFTGEQESEMSLSNSPLNLNLINYVLHNVLQRNFGLLKKIVNLFASQNL